MVYDFKITDEIYKATIRVIIGKPQAYALREWEGLGGEELREGHNDGITLTGDHLQVIIWMEKLDYGVLIHELNHATWHILRTCMIKPSAKTEEAYCYYLGFLFSECKKRLT